MFINKIYLAANIISNFLERNIHNFAVKIRYLLLFNYSIIINSKTTVYCKKNECRWNCCISYIWFQLSAYLIFISIMILIETSDSQSGKKMSKEA
jgi:hypothetical protein